MVALPERSQPTVDAIYKVYEEDGNKPYLTPRMGAANAGAECERQLWYSFHWTTPKVWSGRMLRLFQTGHIEESRMSDDLRRAGVTVLDLNPDTGKQWELVDETGHIVCRMDAAIIGLHEAPKTWHVGEFKTFNLKTFTALKKDGVKKSKPEHYAQCQIGMHFSGMTRAFYLARCKDNDELWSCRIEYDVEWSTKLVARLQRIIMAPYPPGRISEDPCWFKCSFCDHKEACHFGALPERSCRNCLHSKPTDNAGWLCTKHNVTLNREEQRQGCPDQRMIPDLVHGEQTDVDGDTVIYLLKTGELWRDEGPYRET